MRYMLARKPGSRITAINLDIITHDFSMTL